MTKRMPNFRNGNPFLSPQVSEATTFFEKSIIPELSRLETLLKSPGNLELMLINIDTTLSALGLKTLEVVRDTVYTLMDDINRIEVDDSASIVELAQLASKRARLTEIHLTLEGCCRGFKWSSSPTDSQK